MAAVNRLIASNGSSNRTGFHVQELSVLKESEQQISSLSNKQQKQQQQQQGQSQAALPPNLSGQRVSWKTIIAPNASGTSLASASQNPNSENEVGQMLNIGKSANSIKNEKERNDSPVKNNNNNDPALLKDQSKPEFKRSFTQSKSSGTLSASAIPGAAAQKESKLTEMRKKLTNNATELKKQRSRDSDRQKATFSELMSRFWNWLIRKKPKEPAPGEEEKDKQQSLKSKLKRVGAALNKEKVAVDKEAEDLNQTIRNMNPEKLQEKAYRHIIDGLLYRSVRHDLDREGPSQKFILSIWGIQNSAVWNDFLLFLGWVFIFMSFFEPTNRNDQSLELDSFKWMVSLEILIVFLQTLDLSMEILQRFRQDKNSNILQVIFSRKKNLFRCAFFLLNMADLINYASSYPENTFRFARIIRPLQIIIFSKPLRRNFQGIVSSARNLLMILFFYVLIICFWAYIGTNMISDLYEDPELDIMFLLLFQPIPVAVVYEGFRGHRLNLLIRKIYVFVLLSTCNNQDSQTHTDVQCIFYVSLMKKEDRIKRRKALWACFQCIVRDRKKSYIEQEDFIVFFTFVYSKCESDDVAAQIAEVLWMELDLNDNKKLSIEEFFNVLDMTEQRFEYRLQRVKPYPWWRRFRSHMEEKYNLIEFVASDKFQNISFAFTLGSCATTIIGLFSEDGSAVLDYTGYFDKVFLGFFIFEILIKFVSEGIYGFFQETWNVFDLILVLFQIFFDYVFVEMMGDSSVKSLSASRVLKIAKLQKIFRMFRALRTVKILSLLFQGLEFINKVYEMLYKIVICIPIVMRLSVICVIVMYIYAIIGVEIFSTNLVDSINPQTYGQNLCAPGTNTDDFNTCEYATFDSFGSALIVLLQVCVGSGWGYIEFEYAKKFDDFYASFFFFNSFHFISVFVLSLIGGLVWEVFDVVERIMRDQQAYQAQLEIQSEWDDQQRMLEGSFQSGLGAQGAQKESKKKPGGIARPSILNALAKFKGSVFNPKDGGEQTHTEEDDDNQNGESETKIAGGNMQIAEESESDSEDDDDDDDDDDEDEDDNEDDDDDDENDSQGNHEQDDADQVSVQSGEADGFKYYSNAVTAAAVAMCSDRQNAAHINSSSGNIEKQLNDESDLKEIDGVAEEHVHVNQSVRQNISDLDYKKTGHIENIPTEQILVPNMGTDRPDTQETVDKSISLYKRGTVGKSSLAAGCSTSTPGLFSVDSVIRNQLVLQKSDDIEAEEPKDAESKHSKEKSQKGNKLMILKKVESKGVFSLRDAFLTKKDESSSSTTFALNQRKKEEESEKQIKKKKKKKKIKESRKKIEDKKDSVIEDNGDCFDWSCFEDERFVTQRERGQLILFQEKFQLSTEDGFYLGRTLPMKHSLVISESKKSQHIKILSQIQEEDDQFIDEQLVDNPNKSSSTFSNKNHLTNILSQNTHKSHHETTNSLFVNKSLKRPTTNINHKHTNFNSLNTFGVVQLDNNNNPVQASLAGNDDPEEDCFSNVSQEIPCKSPRQTKTLHNLRDFSSSGGFLVSDATHNEAKKKQASQEFNHLNASPNNFAVAAASATATATAGGAEDTMNLQLRAYHSSRQDSFSLSGITIGDHQKLTSVNVFSPNESPRKSVRENYYNSSTTERHFLASHRAQQKNQNNLAAIQQQQQEQKQIDITQKVTKSTANNRYLDQVFLNEKDDESTCRNKSPASGKLPQINASNHQLANERGLQQQLFVEDENKLIDPLETSIKASGGLFHSQSIASLHAPITEDDEVLLIQQKQLTRPSNFSMKTDEIHVILLSGEDSAHNNHIGNHEEQSIGQTKLIGLDECVIPRNKKNSEYDVSVDNEGNIEAGFLHSPNNALLGANIDGIERIGCLQSENNLKFSEEIKERKQGEQQQLEASFIMEVQEIQGSISESKPVENDSNSSLGQSDVLNYAVLEDSEVPGLFLEASAAGIANGIEIRNNNIAEKIHSNSPSKRTKALKKKASKLEKNRAELLRYYREGLLDVDQQNGNLSGAPIKNSLASLAFSKAKTMEYKSTQRELIQDAPGNKLLKQHVMNMNMNLRQSEPFQMMIDLSNMNYIINKAILKNLNQEKVEKVEIRHFRSLYGSQFEDMLDTEIFPLWQVQSKILFHFDNTLKYDHIPIESFIQLFSSLELQMSSLLMNKFSHLKFIFQVGGTDEWFTVNYLADSYYCQSLRRDDGPWEFFDELFFDNDKERLTKHRNVFSYASKSSFVLKKLKSYFTVAQAISNNPYFRKLQINQKRSDVIYIPFSNDSIERSRKRTYDSIKIAVKTPEYIFEEDIQQAEIPYISNALIIAHLTDNPIAKDRDRRMRSGNSVSIEHAIVEEDVLEKEQLNATLNYPYSVEFLKDIRNHVEMNKQRLFSKIAQFYYHRFCFEKNFAKISAMPFQ